MSGAPDRAHQMAGQRTAGAKGVRALVEAIQGRWRALVRRWSWPNTAQAMEALVAAVPFGLAFWDRHGRMVACNALYERCIGGEAERVETDYRALVRQMTREGVLRVAAEAEDHRTLELTRPDSTCLLIEERPLAGGGFVTTVTDVTEQRRAEAVLTTVRHDQRLLARRYHEEKLRAEAASRSKSTFLAHLSHDIRTPLNHIIGFAEMMRHQPFGPLGDPRYVGYAEMIKMSGERLLASFATILDFAELESGRRPLRQDLVPVDEMVQAVARRFAAPARQARLRLGIGASCGSLVTGDRFCLERMLGNIMENAIRFTGPGGSVTLSAYAADDGVVLEVADTGTGMSEERLADLSQPFVFADATFTRERGGSGGGSGLGIAIARAIAERSGGHLVFDSSPGLGTTVAITLPLSQPDEARSEAA